LSGTLFNNFYPWRPLSLSELREKVDGDDINPEKCVCSSRAWIWTILLSKWVFGKRNDNGKWSQEKMSWQTTLHSRWFWAGTGSKAVALIFFPGWKLQSWRLISRFLLKANNKIKTDSRDCVRWRTQPDILRHELLPKREA